MYRLSEHWKPGVWQPPAMANISDVRLAQGFAGGANVAQPAAREGEGVLSDTAQR